MRGGNSLKNIIIVGLIAGFILGIVNTIFYVSGIFELFSVFPLLLPASIQTIVITSMIIGILWGIIYSIFYSFFYDYIPGKGVKKGLIYGLIIWIVAPFHYAAVVAMYGGHLWAIPYIISAFVSTGIIYGLVLGYLYKKK